MIVWWEVLDKQKLTSLTTCFTRALLYEVQDVWTLWRYHGPNTPTTMLLPPQEAEKIWQRPSDPQKVIQWYNWEQLSAIQDVYTRRSQRKAPKNVRLLPPKSECSFGYHMASGTSGTSRTLNSFYPQAIRLLNKPAKWLPGLPALTISCTDSMHTHWTLHTDSQIFTPVAVGAI
jgi:hypothetical protein